MAKIVTEGECHSSAVEVDRTRAIDDMKSAGQDLQGRVAGRYSRRQGIALQGRRLRRPLPRSAPPRRRRNPGVQADRHRRLLLARRLQAQDAPAHLRHRLLVEEGPRGAYLVLLEEAKKRDHRRLGSELDLFSFHDEGPGFPVLPPQGHGRPQRDARLLAQDAPPRGVRRDARPPSSCNEALWHQSGHWDHYRENMYFTRIDEVDYAVKPMNCPGNMLIYKTQSALVPRVSDARRRAGPRPPARAVRRPPRPHARAVVYAGRCAHLLPARADGGRGQGCHRLVFEVYRRFGLEEVELELSTRPDHSIGTDAQWELRHKRPRSARSNPKACRTVSTRVKGRFTGRKSTSTSRIASTAAGSAGRFRLISPCRSGSTSNTPAADGRSSAR